MTDPDAKEPGCWTSIPGSTPPGVRLRPFPYPYWAGLAICSDIDECDRATFLAVHRFINKDLGLPAADSFFGVGQVPGQMAYFEADGQTPSADAPLIRQAIRDGLIDAIHSWGDFNHSPPDPGFLGGLADRLVKEFQTHGLSAPIWINHGDPSNRQNLWARRRPEYQGDDPASPYYSADRARALGARYYWLSELTPGPLSAFRPRLATASRVLGNAAKNTVKTLMGKRRLVRPADQLTELAVPHQFRDGAHGLAFSRYTRDLDEMAHPAERHNLHRSLTRGLLNELEETEGFLILYTHLGSAFRRDRDLFAEADRKALSGLARRFHDGQIWVAAAGTLLDYWAAQRSLSWEAAREKDRIVIRLSLEPGPAGVSRTLGPEALDGLTFDTPDPDRTVLETRDPGLVPALSNQRVLGPRQVGLPVRPAPALFVLED
jgi:hypothetical protein